MADPDFYFVIVFVDGIEKHGFYEDGCLKMRTRAMDTIRYGMVRDEGQTPVAAVLQLVEAYEPEVRERIRSAKIGRITAEDFQEVRL